MGGSRRKYKRSRLKVRVGLPRKNPNVFKPAFNVPPKLRSLLQQTSSSSSSAPSAPIWDDQASVIQNYRSFGVVSNPNLLSVRSRTPHMVQLDSLQVLPTPNSSQSGEDADLDDPIDTGSDLEEDDLKSALGKKRRDGKSAPPQPLTAIQRLHIGQLVEKYGDNYQGMYMDRKLNSLQHSIATLEKLCIRYRMYKDKNPLILSN
ncbi:Ribosome biogenesis protein Nop [Parasponia andersonii]|uniref:Nucleolar protein 16 n=1 Tax=Parasponia andersonii TaxID=3476 RepID=A0A2P5CXH4_PARAD|nr:Ribosome biogenesis protein Nop [Parasponia andersonii]